MSKLPIYVQRNPADVADGLCDRLTALGCGVPHVREARSDFLARAVQVGSIFEANLLAKAYAEGRA